jgi:hypothetical protein
VNGEAAKQMVAYMAATWRHEFTESELVIWAETFDGVKPAHAREAFRNLKLVKTFLPSHAEFFEAVEAVGHREALIQQEIESGERGSIICPDCDGNLWVEVDRGGQGHVVRCERCNPEPPVKNPDGSPVEHKAGCSCGRCAYGPKRLAAIRAGRDGMSPRRDRSLDHEQNRQRMGALRDDLALVGRIDEEF